MEQRNNQNNIENKDLISQNNSSLNEIFYSLQNDFKTIQIELEEKTKTNKKLLEDFNHLLFYLEKEIEAVEKLKNEKETYSQSNQDLIDEKRNFGQNMLSLNYAKNEYLKELDYLVKQNTILNQQIENEQKEINELEQERIKYTTLNKEMKLKNNEKLNIIKLNDEAINYFQQQLNNSNININKMVNMINELEQYFKKLQNQYEECSAKHKIIENIKFNNDKTYQELINNIKKKESDINTNINELDSISVKKEELYNYNTKIFNDLDRLQNHIYELVEQNKKLSEKIEKYQKIEVIINNYLRSKKVINAQLNNEQNFIEKKIGNDLKQYLSSENQNNIIDNENKNIEEKNNLDINENKILNNIDKNNIETQHKYLNDNTNLNLNTIKSSENENLILKQNDKDFIKNTYNPLFEEELTKNKSNYNYLGFQKELELEHDYE